MLTVRCNSAMISIKKIVSENYFVSEVNMRVLNFGSLNIDYVYSVKNFVKKGETISSDTLNVYGGGKGLNQSIALSRAGSKVFHAGAIGTDGMFLQDMLKQAGVDTRYLKVSESVRSGNAIIQNDSQGDNCIILYGGANQEITKEMVDEIIDSFDEGDCLVLQNEISEIPYIVERAHERGMKIILNPSPMNEQIFKINLRYVDCFIVNEGEAKGLAKDESLEENELLEHLRSEYPEAEFILTFGEKGSVYLGKEGVIRQKAYHVKVEDTTAAGDTFTGYFLSCRFLGMTISKSLDMASRASAIAVSRKGAAPSIPAKEEVLVFDI